MLYATPTLDTDDLRVLEEIGEMRVELRHQLAVRPRRDRPLRRHMTARAVAGSNTIEGYPATVDDVEAMMSGEEPLDASDFDALRSTGTDGELAERYLYALLPAFLGHRVRRALYQADAELGEASAMRDIRQLRDAGWLIQHGKARGTFYTGGERMNPVRDLVAQHIGPLRDPYAVR